MNANPPWTESDASRWVSESETMRQMCRLIEGTLRLEVDSRPHEIRAAASMVIMLGRENLWSTLASDEESADELDRLVGLASRRMASVKQVFEKNMKANPHLKNDPSYKKFLLSVTQEIRILESRMSDTPSKLPEEPPCTWGKFW